MAISATLPSDALVAEPGGSATLAFDVRNEGSEPEEVEVSLEGLDPEWVALPQPTFSIRPGQSERVVVLLRPPRTSESAAGDYPFLLRVRSLGQSQSGQTETETGILRVRPYHHLSLEISPRKGFITSTRNANMFQVTVANLGNAEQSLQLSGSDPEDACAYDFDRDSITIGPGMQDVVPVRVNPKHRSAVATTRLVAFSITARSAEPHHAAASGQAQLEIRPLISPAGLVFLALLALILGLVYFLQPKPPRITALTVEPTAVVKGQRVRVSWRSEGASNVELRVRGVPVGTPLQGEGSRDIEMKDAGDIVIAAYPFRDMTQGPPMQATVQVTAPVAAPEPKIDLLEPSKTTVRVGQSFVLKYKFNEAVTKAKISPLAKELDLALNSIQITPDTPGKMEYTVVAENSDGKRVQKSFTIEVDDPSLAVIGSLTVEPKEVPSGGGEVTVRWSTTGASTLKLIYEGKEEDLPTLSGDRTFTITRSGKITLRALDGRGKEVRRTINVKVLPAPKPPVDDPLPTDISNIPGTTSSGDPGLGPR